MLTSKQFSVEQAWFSLFDETGVELVLPEGRTPTEEQRQAHNDRIRKRNEEDLEKYKHSHAKAVEQQNRMSVEENAKLSELVRRAEAGLKAIGDVKQPNQPASRQSTVEQPPHIDGEFEN